MSIRCRCYTDKIVRSAERNKELLVAGQAFVATSHHNKNSIPSTIVSFDHHSKNGIVKFVRFEAINNLSSCLERIDRLRRLGRGLKPPVEVSITIDGLATRQHFVRKFQPLRTNLSSTYIIALSKQIALLHRAGLVHGDLCLSNIGIYGKKVYIFDWEPAITLSQSRLRSTFYCIHPQDYEQREITLLTDRFSVLFLALLSQTGTEKIAYHHRSYRQLITAFLDHFQHMRIDKCTSLFLAYLKQKSLTN